MREKGARRFCRGGTRVAPGTGAGRRQGPAPRRGKAQATIEFALVIGVVIVLAVGAIQSLYAFYVTRQVRAAAEEIADVAAVHGADPAAVEHEVPAILAQHRLDAALAEWEVVPTPATYLQPIVVTLRYNLEVQFYGLFALPIPPQQVRRLCEGV